jgi:hypothetical protein
LDKSFQILFKFQSNTPAAMADLLSAQKGPNKILRLQVSSFNSSFSYNFCSAAVTPPISKHISIEGKELY